MSKKVKKRGGKILRKKKEREFQQLLKRNGDSGADGDRSLLDVSWMSWKIL